MTAPSASQIDALLPQTQCRLCGYPGCRPYAEAIAVKGAAINRCPPGGEELIAELAELLDISPLPPDAACGTAAPPAVACIDETSCIGCALCLEACPVDAIVGAGKWMHTVIAAECTGCALCLPPCPVDCITLVATGETRDRATQRSVSGRLRQRHQAHERRLRQRAVEKLGQRAQSAAKRKRETVARAMARARDRLGTLKH